MDDGLLRKIPSPQPWDLEYVLLRKGSSPQPWDLEYELLRKISSPQPWDLGNKVLKSDTLLITNFCLNINKKV